jgi:hypothetical protein
VHQYFHQFMSDDRRPLLFSAGGPGGRKNPYGSINFPLAALIAASVRVAAPSLPRALSVWKSTVRLVNRSLAWGI